MVSGGKEGPRLSRSMNAALGRAKLERAISTLGISPGSLFKDSAPMRARRCGSGFLWQDAETGGRSQAVLASYFNFWPGPRSQTSSDFSENQDFENWGKNWDGPLWLLGFLFESCCNLHILGVKWHIIFAKRWVGNYIHLGAYFTTDIKKSNILWKRG